MSCVLVLLVAISITLCINGLRVPSQKASSFSTLKRQPARLSHRGLSSLSSSSEQLAGQSATTQMLLRTVASALPLLLLLTPDDVLANQYGILAGRTGSLMHPVTMFALFGTSLYAGYLGLQHRRTRTIGDELKALQEQAPKLSSGTAKFPLKDTINKIQREIAAATGDEALVATLQSDLGILQTKSDVDRKFTDLQETRKHLVGMKLRDKHEVSGNILLGAGVTVAILGAFNTYMRAGKLFPGPHLYAGMACTILWALSASLVPYMSKGNDAARSAHIALNAVNVGLFGWQIASGIPILLKVIEKTSWP